MELVGKIVLLYELVKPFTISLLYCALVLTEPLSNLLLYVAPADCWLGKPVEPPPSSPSPLVIIIDMPPSPNSVVMPPPSP